MALTNTTLSSAAAATDNTVLLTATTNLGPGMQMDVDGETMQTTKGFVAGTAATVPVPVQRGVDSVAIAHPSGATVTIYVLPGDVPNPAPGTAVLRPASNVYTSSVTTSAAWTPQPGSQNEDVRINGTSVVALTLTSPLQSQNGKIVTFIGNGKAAHTITYTTVGFGDVGTTADVVTFGANQIQSYVFKASGGIWVNLGPLATATANVSGPSIA